MTARVAISDCCGALIVHHGTMIANITRTQFPEGDERRNIRNDGDYCAACATPCLRAFADTVSQFPENSTETITITNPRLGPGCTIHVTAKTAVELWLETPDGKLLVEALVNSMAEAIAKLIPSGVQYVYDTNEKKVSAEAS